MLNETIAKAENLLKQAEDKIRQDKMQKEIIAGISADIGSRLQVSLDALAQQMQDAVESYLQGIADIKIAPPNVEVKASDVVVQPVNLPEIKIPDIKIPKIEIPKIVIPPIDTTEIESIIKDAFVKITKTNKEPIDISVTLKLE